jgi:hypothetical protein
MWLFTTAGFFSIVQDAQDKSLHHIRTRTLDDLNTLRALIPALPRPVLSHPGSDYPHRILCPSGLLPEVLTTLGRTIEYPNFKSEIARLPAQRDKLPAYHQIWSLMAASADRRTADFRSDS